MSFSLYITVSFYRWLSLAICLLNLAVGANIKIILLLFLVLVIKKILTDKKAPSPTDEKSSGLVFNPDI